MKGLLQSKKFRKNLSKWLFMYILCMGLFTTVITYSKYIANMLENGDEARVSKFNVDLKYCSDENCEVTGTGTYDSGKFRPFDKMEYYFAVDTSKLEVNADLVLTVEVDKHFNIDEIGKITDSGYKPISSISSNPEKTASINQTAQAGSSDLTKYKVIISYDATKVDIGGNCKVVNGKCIRNGIVEDENKVLHYIFNESDFSNILTIGYSAIQKR